MKNRSIVSVAILTASLFASGFAQAAQANAFPEGSFDVGLQTHSDPKFNGVPTGWRLADGRMPGYPGVKFEVVKEEDNTFVRITHSATSPDEWAAEREAAGQKWAGVGIVAEVPVPKGTKEIRVSVRVRAPEVRLGTKLSWTSLRDHPIFMTAEKKICQGKRPAILFNVTSPVTEWIEKEIVITEIPADAAFLQLQPGFFNSAGILEVDDYQVTFK